MTVIIRDPKKRKIGNAKLYKLNIDNAAVKKLMEIDNALVIDNLRNRAKQEVRIVY